MPVTDLHWYHFCEPITEFATTDSELRIRGHYTEFCEIRLPEQCFFQLINANKIKIRQSESDIRAQGFKVVCHNCKHAYNKQNINMAWYGC